MSNSNDHFAINKKMLKIASLWQSQTGSIIYKAFSIVNLIYCIIVPVPFEIMILYQTWGDINAFLLNLGVASIHFIGPFKIINFMFQRNKILDAMTILQDEKYYYKPLDNFKPDLILEKAKKINTVLSTIYFFWVLCGTTTSYAAGFTKLVFSSNSVYLINTSKSAYCFSVLVCCYNSLPMENRTLTDETTRNFCIWTTAFSSYPLLYISLMIVSLDTLFMGLMNRITAHLQVLQGAFKNIRTSILNEEHQNDEERIYDSGHLEEATMAQMKKCIQHFQAIQR